MKKASALLVLAAIAVVTMLAPVAWAADVQGKIKSVDSSGKMVTLDDGTQLMIPPTLTVEKKALKPGANVKASYEEKDGQKVATSLMVMPAR
jgi:ribosomal protein S1